MHHDEIDQLLDFSVEKMNFGIGKVDVKHGWFSLFFLEQLALIEGEVEVSLLGFEDDGMKTAIATDVDDVGLFGFDMKFWDKKFWLVAELQFK